MYAHTFALKICIFVKIYALLNPCTHMFVCPLLHINMATGWLWCLLLLFHKSVWKTQSQHIGMRKASAGSRSGHTSANPTCVYVCGKVQRQRVGVCVCMCMHICINKIKHACHRENDNSNEHKQESGRRKGSARRTGRKMCVCTFCLKIRHRCLTLIKLWLFQRV